MICLDHVHIFSSDVEKTIHFYTSMFDAQVVYDTPLMGKRNIRLDIGGMAMHVYDQKPRSADRGLVNHLGIRTDDLDSLVKRMQAKGVTAKQSPKLSRSAT